MLATEQSLIEQMDAHQCGNSLHCSQVLAEIRPVLGANHTIVSIAAGITLAK
jgi:hypothetical protein